jgi:chromosome segregation ATPase
MDLIYISILIQIPVYIGLFITVKKILIDDIAQKHTIEYGKNTIKQCKEEIYSRDSNIVSLMEQISDFNRNKKDLEIKFNNLKDGYNELVIEYKEVKKQVQKRDPKTGRFITKK